MRRSDGVFLTFFQFGFNAALFQLRQMFDKHDAHQVVQFVLHADCQQAVCFQREFLAFSFKASTLTRSARVTVS